MQSIPVSPPPITITFLPAGADLGPGLGGARGPPLLRGHPAVALVEVIHGGVDSGQLAPGRLDLAGYPAADRDDQRVVALLQLLGADVAADVGVVDELDALLLEDRPPGGR